LLIAQKLLDCFLHPGVVAILMAAAVIDDLQISMEQVGELDGWS
jgi:hypothetical protein